ncbi:M20/M25/M40 family metallo-hydrolase [Pedobacter psychroterrae]|uniref:M28 family peptidase n=1 Tax=Pedobacter psychroterrae TaxID=2530453 RepID=A0A4R0NHZ4_9SPHI|nr:M20/M25/M40 family metallo-hydrolase [Pedobacter psychroterrae]TCC99838.1 M28 family peptidase [Pedobacter psychroterrae]
MKLYLLIIATALLGCSSAKKTEAQPANQLLKDVEILSSDAYQGRKTGTTGAEMARKYIAGRFRELNLAPLNNIPAYEQPFSFKNEKGQVINGINMIASVKGKSDHIIVISAHYDHIGIINNEIYNGADDNASGVAGLLKLAAYFKSNKPSHTLIFAAFDAEEMGLQGAKYFVSKPPVPIEKIKLNINMDMISHNDKGELYACGTFKYPQLKPFINTASKKIKVLPGHDDPKLGIDNWTGQSDHSAFNDKDIPFIYFGVEDHKDYHKASDEFKNINQDFLINAVSAIQEITSRLDKQLYIKAVINEKKIMNKQ